MRLPVWIAWIMMMTMAKQMLLVESFSVGRVNTHVKQLAMSKKSYVPPGAKHSTERLEEPGKRRNYGTEYTKPKKSRQTTNDSQSEKELLQKTKSRVWSFGKVPWW
jgi:hypothetical protein